MLSLSSAHTHTPRSDQQEIAATQRISEGCGSLMATATAMAMRRTRNTKISQAHETMSKARGEHSKLGRQADIGRSSSSKMAENKMR